MQKNKIYKKNQVFTDMQYEDMLEKAIKEMPSVVHEKERFEIPKIKGHQEGNKTIIINLNQIAEKLARPMSHFFKYLLKELASPGSVQNNRAILGTKVPASKVNDKIRKYAEEFVLCKKCGKPDTKLLKEGELVFLKCQVCAEKYVVKTKL